MSRKVRAARAFLGALLLLACGCAGDAGGRQKVSGTVSFEGQPLPQGTIEFFRAGGPPGPAAGALIRDGAYTIPAEHGLVLGVYRVTLSSPVAVRDVPPNSMGSPPTRERIPARYNTQSQTTVEVGVNSPNRFDFNLEP